MPCRVVREVLFNYSHGHVTFFLKKLIFNSLDALRVALRHPPINLFAVEVDCLISVLPTMEISFVLVVHFGAEFELIVKNSAVPFTILVTVIFLSRHVHQFRFFVVIIGS